LARRLVGCRTMSQHLCVPAQSAPRFLYMYVPNRGNAAPKAARMTVFAASALAAKMVYVSIRYRRMLVKINRYPVPNGTEAMIGTIQWTLGFEVHANQKSEIGTRIAPMQHVFEAYFGRNREVRWSHSPGFGVEYQLKLVHDEPDEHANSDTDECEAGHPSWLVRR
jgi:hypothetical protein